MGKYLPIQIPIGERYGLWTVLKPLGKIKKWGNCYWECQCDCGVIKAISATNLVNGKSNACKSGIHMKGRNKTHGMRYTKIYRVWRNMKIRCNNPDAQNYYLYGGRGITVCDRWMEGFENFYEDMKEGYAEGLSLERIDVNGNYCKENCRWVTMADQSKNKRNTAYITYKGVTKRAFDWAELIGANPKTLSRRVYLGWSPEECLFGKSYERIKKIILAESLLNYTI